MDRFSEYESTNGYQYIQDKKYPNKDKDNIVLFDLTKRDLWELFKLTFKMWIF